MDDQQSGALLTSRVAQLRLQAEGALFAVDPAAFLEARPRSLIGRTVRSVVDCPPLRPAKASIEELVKELPRLSTAIRTSMRRNVAHSTQVMLAGIWAFVQQQQFDWEDGEDVDQTEGHDHDGDTVLEALGILVDSTTTTSTAAAAVAAATGSATTAAAATEGPLRKFFSRWSQASTTASTRRRSASLPLSPDQPPADKPLPPLPSTPLALPAAVPVATRSLQDTRKSPTKMHRHQFMVLFNAVLKDIETSGECGVDRLFKVIKAAPTLDTLPTAYKDFFLASFQIIAPKLPAIMNDDRKRDMLRELMQKLPRRIILSVFRWTNPIAMTSRIVSLLMSKPFGTKTLLQRVVMTLTGVSRTKEELRLATEAVPKSLRPVVHQFVNAWMHQHPPTSDEETEAVMTVDDIAKVFTKCTSKISDEIMMACFRMASLEVRQREKLDYVEFIGSPTMTKAIKELLPVLQKPFVEMYSAGNLYDLVSAAMDLLQWIVDTGDRSDITPVEKLKQYNVRAAHIRAITYVYLHQLFSNDKGMLHELLQWMHEQWKTADRYSGIDDALASMTDSERKRIDKHVHELARVYAEGLHISRQPPVEALIKLTGQVSALCETTEMSK